MPTTRKPSSIIDLSSAAVFVQRLFRTRRFLMKNLGPLVFAKADGGKAKWGQVHFDGDGEGDGQAERRRDFISLSKHSSSRNLAEFVKQFWQVGWPEILVSVNGGAQDFQLSPRLRRVCMAGFAQIASSGKVCFFTAGTDAGVTKFIADILAMFEVNSDVIGVLTLECVSGFRGMIADADSAGGTVHYASGALANNQWGARLNRNHSKYIFVDTGWEKSESDKAAPWGREVTLRGELESELSAKVRAPIVQLLVQGGPGSLDMTLSAVRNGTAVVAIADSGGAATALHRVVQLGEDAASVARQVWKLTNEEQIGKMAAKLDEARGRHEAMMARTMGPDASSSSSSGGSSPPLDDDHSTDRLIHFFVMDEREPELNATARLKTMLLAAIVSRLTATPHPPAPPPPPPPAGGANDSKQQPDASTSSALSTRSSGTAATSHRRATFSNIADSQQGLKTAATSSSSNNNNDDLAGAAQLRAGLNLAVAWDCLPVAEPIIERASLPVLLHAVQRALRESRVGFLERIVQQVGRQRVLERVDLPLLYAHSRSNAYLGECRQLHLASSSSSPPSRELVDGKAAAPAPLLGFFDWVSPHVGAFVRAAKGHVRWIDIFLWATLSGRWKLADFCWPCCEDPLLAVVLGAAACRKVGKGISRQVARAAMLARANELEQSAVGIFDTLPSAAFAHRILATRVDGLDWVTLLELSMILEMKQVLAHNHSLSLMQLYWHGGSPLVKRANELPIGYPYWRLLFHMLLPVWRPQPNQKAAKEASEKVHANALMSALAMFEKERSKAVGAPSTSSSSSSSGTASSSAASSSSSSTSSASSSYNDVFKDFLSSVESTVQAVETRDAEAEGGGGGGGGGGLGGGRRGGRRGVRSESVLDFYRIPKVAFILRSLSVVVLIILCTLQLLYSSTPEELDAIAPAIPPLSALDAVQIVCFVSIFVDELEQGKDQTRLAIAGQQSLLQRFLYYSRLVYIAAVTMRLISISLTSNNYATARASYTAFGLLLSTYTTCITLSLLEILSRVSRPFGVLVLAIQKMLVAIDNYLLFSLLMVFGMALGVLGFQIFGAYENAAIDDTTPSRTSWYMLPFFAYMSPSLSGLPSNDWDGASAIFPLMYLFLSSKVLNSLLTATFSSALRSIFENAEQEYVFDEHRSLFEYRHVIELLPPPINLPLTAFRLLSYRLLRLTSHIQTEFYIGKVSKDDELSSTSERVSIALFVEQYRKSHKEKRDATVDSGVAALREQMQEVDAKVTAIHADLTQKIDRLQALIIDQEKPKNLSDRMGSLLKA